MATQPINTLEAANRISKSRAEITSNDVGEFRVFTVRGNGNIIDVRTKEGDLVPSLDGSGVPLRKRIFNVKCNSRVAVTNAMNKELLMQAYQFEKAGNLEKSAELYNEFLQNIEVSFGVLSGTNLFNLIQDGDQIKAKVIEVVTEKGTLLTLDPKTIAIMKPQYAAPSTTDLTKFIMAVPEESEMAIEQDVETTSTTARNKKVVA